MLYKLCVLVFGLTIAPCNGRKNVLFLMADDMRPEIGAYYGPDFPSHVHPRMHTPNLNALAAKSLLLKRAYVQQALCSPSRTSLLTGRRPDTTHVYDLDNYFRNVGGNFTTLPQYFKENGYMSLGMGKIFHHGKASGGDDPISWSKRSFNGHSNFHDTHNSWKAIPDHLLKDNPLIDAQIADHAIATLQDFTHHGKHQHSNFFLAVGFIKPHLPFVFPESVLQYYPEDEIRLPPNPSAPVHMPTKAWTSYNELRAYDDISRLNCTGAINTTLPDKNVKDLRRAYYCALTWTDIQVGRVLAELDRLGLANNTIVSFLGDHGYQLGEHGEWCKHSNFELATHAPLMFRIPGVTDHGISTTQLVEFVDIFPTLVEAAGLNPLTLCPVNSADVKLCREGTSVVPLINNPNTAIKSAAFSQYPRGKTVMGYSIRTEQYRYTQWVRFHQGPDYKPDWTQLFGEELYDHTKGREENYNAVNSPALHNVKLNLRRALHNGWRHGSQHGPAIVG